MSSSSSLPQRWARPLAMSPAELDGFLAEQRTCRVATAGPGGPHVAPLWFLWLDGALWLTSLTRSQRWTDLERDPRIAVVIDAGEQYGELRGAELRGRVERVGEAPRVGEDVPALARTEQAFTDKYFGGGEFPHDGRHAWLRLVPERILSWDFRKIPGSSG